ncbi:MAG: phage holin family protein [Ilumatobacteraceae bacterium]|nr:phage holin family protein [Ilumatobacteraceae bacterium]
MIDTNVVPESNTPKPDDPSLGEIVDTVKAYAKQETVGPLKGAGRWLGFGAAAALLLGVGLVFVLVGLLRLLQTEWDRSASGSLSWLAYLIVLAVAIAILAVTVSRIKKSTLNNEPK